MKEIFHFDRSGGQIGRSEFSLEPTWLKMKEIFHFDRSGGQIGRSEFSLRPTWLKLKEIFHLTDLEAGSVEVNFHFD